MLAKLKLQEGWLTFLLLAGISLLAMVPSLKLPNVMLGELSAEEIISEKRPKQARPKGK